MPKYRRKPIVVEAAQWTADHNMSRVPGVHIEPRVRRRDDTLPPDRFYVFTAHGQKVYLEDGDWVVALPLTRKPSAEYAAYKPEDFATEYEPIPEAAE